MRVQFSSFHTESIRQVQERFAAQPNWAVRAALITFAFIVILPLVLLVGIAFLISLLVFGVLGLVNRLGGMLTGRGWPIWRRDSAGRQNVTVRRREN